jgi:hypothetical protein
MLRIIQVPSLMPSVSAEENLYLYLYITTALNYFMRMSVAVKRAESCSGMVNK